MKTIDMSLHPEPDLVNENSFEKLSEMLDKAFRIRISNISESVSLANAVLDISIKNEFSDIAAKARNLLGLFLMITGDFEKSRLFSQEALNFFIQNNDLKGIADAKYNLASTYYKTDDYHRGLHSFLECLRIYRLLKDAANEARVLKSIGTIYEYFGDVENAVVSYEKSIEVAKIAQEPALESNAYNPLSSIYLKQGKAAEAFAISEKSIAIKLATNDRRGLAFAIYGRGKVFLKLTQYERALKDFTESLYIQRETQDHLGEGMVLNKLGLTYMHLDDFENAEKNLLQALKIGQQYHIRLITYKAFYNLYELHKKQHQWKEASACLEKYITLREATINLHTLNTIKSYEAIAKLDTLEKESKAQKAYFEVIEKKNAEMDLFFYRISHDLKGPIASLLGLHNIIQYEQFEPEAVQYFDMYHSQIKRINNIVLDLIDLTHMNNNAEKKVKINFNEIILSCVQSFAYHPNFDKIKFIYEIQEDLVFYSQWVIVNTILQNLIENAIKYCRIKDNEPFVKIMVSHENEKLKIMIEDNGQGIPEEFQHNIFDMFFRANEKSKGSGLGLYILKRAVERLNGTFKLESEVGTGSAFTVYLPY